MGQLVYIRMKEGADLKKINKHLETVGIANSLMTDDMINDWVEDINNNPDSPQKHLKPVTKEELVKMFSSMCETGQLSFDVGFSRTSQEEADDYARFITDFKDEIKSLHGADELIKRYSLTEEQVNVINSLNVVPPEPRKLPKDQRTKHDLQGGQLLCKSWGLNPFWVIFGKVDSPVFMKDRIYEDELYNSLYKDDNKRAYLLIPLLPLNDKQVEFVGKVYTEAYNMGLRENINLFAPSVYGLDLTDYNEVVEDFKKWYTPEELEERFWQQFERIVTTYPYNQPRGIMWNDRRKMFQPCGYGDNPTVQHQAKCSLLTCLIRSIDSSKAAEMMTRLTGRKCLKFEFE